MKKNIFFAILLLSCISNAQVNLNIGVDPKIAIFGTDNQYTKHDALFNYELKLEVLTSKKHYFAIGHKFVNLSQKYNSYYVNIGKEYSLSNRISVIPNIELGLLKRKLTTSNNAGIIYPQINTSLRYNIGFISFGYKGYLQWSRDIGKTFRYGGVFEVTLKIFNLKDKTQ